MRLGEDLLGAFDAICGHLDCDANLLEILLEYLLVYQVVLDNKYRIPPISHPLLDFDVALFLVFHHTLRRRSIPVDTEVSFFVRIEDDGEAGWLHWFVDVGNTLFVEEFLVLGIGNQFRQPLPLHRVG